jgi:hypothetical protein
MLVGATPPAAHAEDPVVYPVQSSLYARLVRGGDPATNYVGLAAGYSFFDRGPVGWSGAATVPGGVLVTLDPASGSFTTSGPGPLVKVISRAAPDAPKGNHQGSLTFTASGVQDPFDQYADLASLVMVAEVAADNTVRFSGGGASTVYLEAERGQRASRSVLLNNDGPDRLYHWQVTPGAGWLSVDPAAGDFIPTLEEGGYTGRQKSLVVTADPFGLAPGTYTSKLVVTAANLRTATYEYPVTFTVKPSTHLALGRLDQKLLARGADLALLIHGSFITPPVTVEFLRPDGTVDPGITFPSVAVNGTDRISAVCSVAPDAALGPRTLRITCGPDQATLADAVQVIGLSLEVNQGAKTAPDALRSAYHPTVVRAFVESAGPAGIVSGLLYVFDGENQVVGSPFQPGILQPSDDAAGGPLLEPVLRIDPPYTAQERFYLRNSLNFYFECDNQTGAGRNPPLLPGRREFWLALASDNPGNPPDALDTLTRTQLATRKDVLWCRTLPVQEFRYLRPYHVLVVIDNRLGAAAARRIEGLLGLTQRYLNAAFPGQVALHTRDELPREVLDLDALRPAPWNPVGSWWANVHARLAEILAAWNRERGPALRFDQIVLATDATGVQAICGPGTLGMADKSTAAIVGDYPTTFAHELAHNFGLGDTYCGYTCGSPLNLTAACYVVGANCRRADALPGGNRVEDGAVRLVPVFSRGRDPVAGGTACVNEPGGPFPPRPGFNLAYRRLDLMGIADDDNARWPDLVEWNHLFNALLPAPGTAGGEDPQLVLRGILHTDGRLDAVTLALEPERARTSTVPGPDGPYALVQFAADGHVLTREPFDVDFRAPGIGGVPAVSFAISAAWNDRARRVELRHGQAILLTRALSLQAPTVTVLEPSTPALSGPVVTVRWAASDPDGDPLRHTVFFVKDDGSPVPLAAGLGVTEFAWRPGPVGGCQAGRIVVVSSDGFHEGRGESAVFSLPRQAPHVAWLAPASGTALPWGTPVTLAGAGSDPEDGLLGPAALSFRSSRDGALGSGAFVDAWLGAGRHVLTLQGRDSDGNTATAAIEVVVSDTDPVPILAAIDPPAAFPGATVQIVGEHFDPATLAVQFDGLPAALSGATTTTVLAQVPDALPPGPVEVTVTRGGLTTRPLPFRVAPPPALQARMAAEGVELRWPETTPAFVLEMASTPGPAGAWNPANTPAQLVDGWRVLTLPVAGAARFYRLVLLR